jgi:polyisoprenoid-binding protein YceI
MTASTWAIDAVHSSAEFSLEHLGVSTYRGRFRAVKGTVVLDDDSPANSSIEAAIDVRSVDVDDKKLFDSLMGGDFFDVERHPHITFKSAQVEKLGDTQWRAQGELTIRGVTRPIELTIEDKGGANNPFAKRPMRAFLAHGEIDRGEYELRWNVPLDNGGQYLGERVAIDLHIELLKQG